MYKKHSKTYTRHEPKGEKAHYQAKPRPNKMDNKIKSRSNQLQLAQNFHKAILEDQRITHDETGLKVAHVGCG